MVNTTTPNHYGAAEIKVLEGLEPVRKRPGMYIGSTDTRGLHHLAKEILDNAVDEAIAGYGKRIQLFHAPVTPRELALLTDPAAKFGEESITVVDNGRGIPVDMHSSGVSALEVVLTKLHAGGKFEETAYQASGGLHGVGSSAVNALSTLLEVIVKRNGKYHYQFYSQGKPQASVKILKEAQVLEILPNQAKQLLGYTSGTALKFIPDPTIFSTTKFSHKTLQQVIKDRAYLMAGIYFQLHDDMESTEEHFYFEGGVKSLVEHINMDKKAMHDVFYCEDTWTDETTGKRIGMEISLQYNDSYFERLESYVNVIHTPDGGAHVNGFRMALGKTLRDYADRNKLMKDNEAFTAEDIKEGMAAVVFVKMPSNDLQFESQTKTKLNNSEAQSAVYAVFKQHFETFLEENPRAGKTIIEKVMLSARARLAARAAKEAVIRKGVFEGSTLPGKLADCQSKNADECEIYIVEGDSAGGCFSGDTQIALTDGRNLSFKELVVEQSQGKEHFCYTIRKDGKIGIEKILHPRITKQEATVIKLTIDTGETIICTPDHLFMLRDGTYKRADQLTPKNSLMPLYRKFSDINQPKITIDGYEMVWDPYSETWLFTHILADWHNRWQKVYSALTASHCHHRDFNKLNNNPTNIVRMSPEAHLELHRTHIAKTLHRPEVKEKCRQLKQKKTFKKFMSERMKHPTTRSILSKQAKAQWEQAEYKNFMIQKWLDFYRANPSYQLLNKAMLNNAQQKYWSSVKNRQTQAQRTKKFFEDNPDRRELLSQLAQKQWENENLIAWRSEKTKNQWTPEFRVQRQAALTQTYYKKTIATLKLFEKAKQINVIEYDKHRIALSDKSILKYDTFCQRYFTGNSQKAAETIHNFNHKIISIEYLQEKIAVYDIEVPHTHNFALASGIFVHNSAKQGRDRKFQAIFPLRGKILNTERARLDKIVAFEELKNLVIALGAGIGDTFKPEKLRYHRIILMNDADVDGQHITTLGLTFFFRHLPKLVEEGYLYIAMPPLFKVSAAKQEDRYVYTEDERDNAIAAVKEKYPKATISVQRYKGLGEMNPEQLWETTMDPKSRILKNVSIEDAQEADKTFDMLMGDEVGPRKKFIQTHASMAELDV